MSAARAKYNSLERAAAIGMHESGIAPSSIAAQLNIPLGTVQHWVYVKQEADATRAKIAKRKSSAGSGVIAPPPFHRGSVWGAGW